MKLFTPGPIMMDPETIIEAGRQSQYFRTPEFSQIVNDCAEMLGEVLNVPDNAKMVFLTASGTAAMEAAVINIFTERDKILIINGGSFGERFKQICEIHRLNFVSIDLEWNEPFAPEILTDYIHFGFTGMLVNVCETSTGQKYPMETIAEFCKENNICLVIDAISSFLCDSVRMKALSAGAVIISSQKGLALQPGMSFIAVSEEVYRERCEQNEVRSLYFRFTDYVNDMARGQTPYSPAVSIINQLYYKLDRILSEGMWAQIYHIVTLASYFREQLAEKTRLTVPAYPLSNCLTPVYCEKNNALKIVEVLRDRYDIYVTPCSGSISPFLFRVAHMSRQLSIGDIDELVELLRFHSALLTGKNDSK
ncbi:MAG: aminotransferase class V-fold PLP-dependent enzyme [Spirochaetaceae bacterium]|jgi:aspartate aminotransferase-like enzyme|nr:aminotransferase class V-fold PLP-dependent enzyme [Spirochaetaceae bacterium]